MMSSVKGMPAGLFSGRQGGQRLGGLRFGWRVGRADFRRKFRYAPAQLGGYLYSAHPVAAKYFGMAVNERHRERESQQQDQADGGESAVGHQRSHFRGESLIDRWLAVSIVNPD